MFQAQVPAPSPEWVPPTMVCPAPAPVGWHAAAVAFPRRRLWVAMLLLLLLLPAPITASATQQLSNSAATQQLSNSATQQQLSSNSAATQQLHN